MLDESVKVTLGCEDKASIPLEKLIETLCDTSDLTDAEVRAELAEQGIDLDAEKAKFLPKLDALMAARAGRQAIEALKETAPDTYSPMPWTATTEGRERFPMIRDDEGDEVATFALKEDRDHALAATLAAPHLLARVAELEAENASLQARFDGLLSAAQEVAEVARLRGEGHLNPENDPVLWTSRWNEALANIAEEVEK